MAALPNGGNTDPFQDPSQLLFEDLLGSGPMVPDQGPPGTLPPPTGLISFAENPLPSAPLQKSSEERLGTESEEDILRSITDELFEGIDFQAVDFVDPFSQQTAPPESQSSRIVDITDLCGGDGTDPGLVQLSGDLDELFSSFPDPLASEAGANSSSPASSGGSPFSSYPDSLSPGTVINSGLGGFASSPSSTLSHPSPIATIGPSVPEPMPSANVTQVYIEESIINTISCFL